MANGNLSNGPFSETTAVEDTDVIAIKKDSGDGLWRYMTGANFKLQATNVVYSGSDTGTDVYQYSGAVLASGDTVVVDFDSANTTASPTLENTGGAPSGAQSIVDVDGNARIGMIEARPHRLQWDGTNFVLLDQQFLRPAPTSTDPGLAFDTWRTPNADRTTMVTVGAQAVTDGVGNARVRLNVDESGGTTADYTFVVAFADLDAGSNVTSSGSVTVYVPAGGSYRVENADDPNTANLILEHREYTL